MGFFSWHTVEGEVIRNSYTKNPTRGVYLLNPFGENVYECEYDGDGNWAGKSVFAYLGMWNAHKLGISISRLSDEEVESIGHQVNDGRVYYHKKTDTIYYIFNDPEYKLVEGAKVFKGTYNAVMPEIGMSANDAIESGELIEMRIREFIDNPYVLKFSKRKDAEYDSEPESNIAACQGYF